MDRLEHRVARADIRAAGGADSALELRRFVGDDVAVEVRQHEDGEVAAALFVEQLRGGDVDIPLVRYDFGIFRGDGVTVAQEVAVGRLNDVRLLYQRNAGLAVRTRELVSEPRDAGAPLLRRHGEVKGEVVCNVHALRAEDVGTLGVLAEEGPVDALLGDLDRANVREKVERLAHRDVRALDIGHIAARLRSRSRSLENDVAILEFFHDVVRDCLAARDAVLYRQPVYVTELDLPRLHFAGEEVFEHALRFFADDGAYAVAAADADDELVKRGVVDEVGVALHLLDAGELFFNEFSEMFNCFFGHTGLLYLCEDDSTSTGSVQNSA